MEQVNNSRIESFLENPSKALWTLAIPIMFGMGIHTLYNLIDMIFIGRLGGSAIAGVAFNMPIFFFDVRTYYGFRLRDYICYSKIHW